MKLLDTTVLIDILRGKKEVLKIVESSTNHMTTQINMYETIRGLFLQGISSEKFLQASEIFEHIRVLSLDDASIIKSAQISADLTKKGIIISDSDCITAGIALSNGITRIVTNNKKHFERISGIVVETY